MKGRLSEPATASAARSRRSCVVSIVALHLIITASFLLHRPDQPRAVVRPRPRPARRGRAVARRRARVGTAAAVRRHRARLSAARHRRSCRRRHRAVRRSPTSFTRTACSGASAHDYRDRSSSRPATMPAGSRIGCRTAADDFGQRPAGDRPTAAVSRRPLDDDAAVCRHQRDVAGPVGGARADRAAVVLREGRREFQPQRRRGAAARTRAGGNPLGRARAQPHARAHHRPDRRPHQNAGRDQPRSAHADHADAPALRIHRGRDPSQPHARAISTRCARCWNRCCRSCATAAGSRP